MRRVTPTPFPHDPAVGDAVAFGRAVRAARSAAGMTLVDAALAVGVSKQTLSDLETARASVGVAAALRIARDLGVALFAVPGAEREPIRRVILSAREPGAPYEVGHDAQHDDKQPPS